MIARAREQSSIQLTAAEQDPSMTDRFVWETRNSSEQSSYALWTTMIKDVPTVQGPFDKALCLQWLATHLESQHRIVRIAKDGKLVGADEFDVLLSEAVRLLAQWKAEKLNELA